MDKTPKISIIIPVYNVEKYLAKCLDSVLSQTFTDWEVICVNDGSPDNCSGILHQYAQKDSRIKVIEQPNQGPAGARNNGFKSSKGDYIAFLDSDDALAPQFLELLYEGLKKNPMADFAWCLRYEGAQYPSWSKIGNITFQVIGNMFDQYFQKQKPKAHTFATGKLYKRSLIQNIQFPEKQRIGEDLVWILQVFYQSQGAVYIPEYLYFYYQNSDSITHKTIDFSRIDLELSARHEIFNLFQNKQMCSKTQLGYEKWLARHFLNVLIRIAKKSSPKNYHQYKLHYVPILRKLEQEGVFKSRYLSLRNKFRYLYLKFTKK